VAPLPTLFGRYRLIQKLGSSDSVFLALVLGSGGARVVRRPPSDLRGDAEFLSRFRRAAHLSRRLAHEGLMVVHDVGEVDGEPYLAEEFFEGHDLAEVSQRCVTETRRFSVISALHVACAISRALGFLHEFEGLGLVHRRLHPARVRLGYQGGVKLLDLASGRAVGTDGVLGPAFVAEELRYLAPEQLGDGSVDRRADIYALGVVLWETLAGCRFLSNIEGGQAGLAGASREQAIERIRSHRSPSPSLFNPEVRPELDAVVMRAVAKAPEQRFATAGEFERALLPMASEAGRDAVARLLNRLFSASQEREQRAALLAAAGGQSSAMDRAEPAAGLSLLESSVVGPRKAPGLVPSPAPVTASPALEGTPAASAHSRTTVVSRNIQWLRRFFLIFGAALVAATVFNVYMTKRLDAEAAAGKAREPLAGGSIPAPSPPGLPQASPIRAATSAPAATIATGQAPGQPPVPRPSRGVEPSGAPTPAGRTFRPAAAPPAAVVAAPESAAGSASELPADKTRARASAEGKKALAEARAAFERDDFSRAISEGRAAVAAGEGAAHAILGAAYFKVGRYDDAVREYGEALRLEPGNPALAKRVEIARRAAGRRAEGASP
jgi:eukaryotic-like serine/threonine-protein kinase